MANRTYEVMYIIDPDTTADKIEKLNEAVVKLIEQAEGDRNRRKNLSMSP